jgi:hypothetical protein
VKLKVHRNKAHFEEPSATQRQTPRHRSGADLSEPINTAVGPNTTRSRRYSSPDPASREIEIDEPKVSRHTRGRSSIPPTPAAPTLRPRHLPSILVRSSWRLSFASENRGVHLRNLSLGESSTVPLSGDKSDEGSQTIDRWLHSQGLRSQSEAITCSEDNANIESLASLSQTCTTRDDFGGVDGPEESRSAVHLHEMRISQRLAPEDIRSSSSSPESSSLEGQSHYYDFSSTSLEGQSHYHDFSSTSETSKAIQNTYGPSRPTQKTSDSTRLSECIPESWGKIVQDGTSSFYPSAGNSIQPSPESSHFNLLPLVTSSKTELDSIEQASEWHSLHHAGS